MDKASKLLPITLNEPSNLTPKVLLTLLPQGEDSSQPSTLSNPLSNKIDVCPFPEHASIQ